MLSRFVFLLYKKLFVYVFCTCFFLKLVMRYLTMVNWVNFVKHFRSWPERQRLVDFLGNKNRKRLPLLWQNHHKNPRCWEITWHYSLFPAWYWDTPRDAVMFHDMNHGMVTLDHMTFLLHWVFGMLNDLNASVSCCRKLRFRYVKLRTTRSRTGMSCRPQN